MAKEPYFVNDTLREQWQVAGKACADSHRLILIGYSLPPTDQLMRFFFSSTVAPKVILPVNITPDVLSSVSDVFPSAKVDGRFVGIADAIPRFASWYASNATP